MFVSLSDNLSIWTYRMGVGRKQENFQLNDNLLPKMKQPATTYFARNLGKSNLGGVIFGCKNNTFKECLSKQIFGMFVSCGLSHSHFY